MEKHVQYDCPLTTVECSFKHIGCKEKVLLYLACINHQNPITRSMIVRYILPSTQSQKCVVLDPDFPRKAVTMMTATKTKNMADKLLARSTISWSDVIKSHIAIGQIRHPLFVSRKKKI